MEPIYTNTLFYLPVAATPSTHFVPDMKLHIFFVILIAVSSAFEETMSLEERGDADATLLKRCHGEFKGALVEKRSLADISELSEILKRCLIGGSRSGKV